MKTRAIFLSCIVVASLTSTGCISRSRNQVPMIDNLPKVTSRSQGLEATYSFAWRVHDNMKINREKRKKYKTEFVEAFKESGYFSSFESGSGDPVQVDVRMDHYREVDAIVNAAYCVSFLILAIPTGETETFKASVSISTKNGYENEYQLKEEMRNTYWLPFIIASPFSNPSKESKIIRNNIYKTILFNMHKDGLIVSEDK